jgi:hypothetical protein
MPMTALIHGHTVSNFSPKHYVPSIPTSSGVQECMDAQLDWLRDAMSGYTIMPGLPYGNHVHMSTPPSHSGMTCLRLPVMATVF